MSEDIKRKIRGLLAMGADKRGNEHEAASALELAARLMTEYGIKQHELNPGEKPTVTRGDQVEMKSNFYWMVASAVSQLYGTRPKLFNTFDKNPKNSKWECIRQDIVFFGRPELVDASQQTFAFIVEQVEQQYKLHLPKNLTQRERALYRRDFKDACADRVYYRACDIRRKIERETPKPTATGGTALTVLDYRAQLQAEIEEAFDKLWPSRKAPPPPVTEKPKKKRKPKERKFRERKTHEGALAAGDAAGHAIKLSKEIK